MTYYLIFIIDFFLLLSVSYYIHQRYLRQAYTATSSGAIVMALSMYTLSVLPQLPDKVVLFAPYLTMQIIIVWLFIVESYLKCYLDRHFYLHMRDMLNRFNIGTWSVSTALLAILSTKMFPEWDEIAWLFALVATAVWIEYLHIAVSEMCVFARKQMTFKLNGSLILPAIATQMIILMILFLTTPWFPLPLMVALFLLSLGLYVGALVLILRSFLQTRPSQLISQWRADNAYMYVGMGLIAYVGATTHLLPPLLALMFWLITCVLMLVIEGVCFFSFWQKRQKEALAVFMSYDATQWTRLFALSLVYMLTVSLLPLSNTASFTHILQSFVLGGKYLITLVLFWQLAVFFQAKYKPIVVKHKPILQKDER